MKNHITVTLNIENAAFMPGEELDDGALEIARIFRALAAEFDAVHASGHHITNGDDWALVDVNGNTVGKAIAVIA